MVVYFDPDTSVGREFQGWFDCPKTSRVADWAVAGRLVRGLPGVTADTLMGGASHVEGGSPVAPHPAVTAAIDRVRGRLRASIRLEEVAAAVGISPSRLGHLFADEVGVSFPVYLRWARLRRAMELARAGASLTQAAHGAGFSDSSHLTRVVHEMFGLAPSELMRGVEWLATESEPDRTAGSLSA